MKKLDESKVKWIISQKQKGVATSGIAEAMNVSARRVKKLWARYRHADAGKIAYPALMGKPKNGLPGRREHSEMLTARTGDHMGAVRLHWIIQAGTGIDIPYNTIHKILRYEKLASENPKKSKRRK